MTTRGHIGAKAPSGDNAADDDLKRLVRLIARQAAQEAFAQFKADLEALVAQANAPSGPAGRTSGAADELPGTSLQSSSPDERYISVREAAKRLDVSEKTVRRKIAAGELPAHRVGRLIRIAERGLSAGLVKAPAGGSGAK
jgi:excisionase family DNA binding protein